MLTSLVIGFESNQKPSVESQESRKTKIGDASHNKVRLTREPAWNTFMETPFPFRITFPSFDQISKGTTGIVNAIFTNKDNQESTGKCQVVKLASTSQTEQNEVCIVRVSTDIGKFSLIYEVN